MKLQISHIKRHHAVNSGFKKTCSVLFPVSSFQKEKKDNHQVPDRLSVKQQVLTVLVEVIFPSDAFSVIYIRTSGNFGV